MVSRRLLTASTVLLALPGIAQAQSVNYAELEQMFGEPVTTSVTGKPQRASDAPAALVIITRDDIRRSPANDIPGLLQAYAGIDVARWTGGQSDVIVRGGVQPFNPRLLVLVNGRQVYLDHYGLTNWAGLGVQLEEIQQIEIVRGPNSALFGFNAVSGVVNIITVNPLQTQQASVTAEVGTEGHRRLSGVAAIKLADRLGLRLSGGYEGTDELDGLKSSVLALQTSDVTFNPRHQEAAGELYAQFDELTEGSVSATYSDNRQIEVPLILYTVPSTYKFTSASARISHDTGWGILSARAFRNWLDVSVPLTNFGFDLRFHSKVFVTSADVLIRAGTANTLRVGLEYRANELTQSPGFQGATHYNVYAGSGMWESQLSNALTFTIAARVDHLELGQRGVVDQPTIFTKEDFDRSITAWSLNSALLFKLSDRNTLRIAGGRGIQAPSLIALGLRVTVPVPGLPIPLVISGNPNIEPAKIWSAEIGFIHTFDPMNSRLELTAFYNRTSDVFSPPSPQTPPIATPPTYPFILSVADNIGSFEAYGLAASLNGRFGQNWSWALNYTWTNVNQHITGNVGDQFQWPLALDRTSPKHKVKAQLSYEQGPWLATVAGRYTSDIKQLISVQPLLNAPPSLIDVKDSLALDAKLAFSPSDHLTFSIAGENLTDAGGVDLSPAPAERRLRASVQVRF
jgi:iron complex outermembrane receptor protein